MAHAPEPLAPLRRECVIPPSRTARRLYAALVMATVTPLAVAILGLPYLVLAGFRPHHAHREPARPSVQIQRVTPECRGARQGTAGLPHLGWEPTGLATAR